MFFVSVGLLSVRKSIREPQFCLIRSLAWSRSVVPGDVDSLLMVIVDGSVSDLCLMCL